MDSWTPFWKWTGARSNPSWVLSIWNLEVLLLSRVVSTSNPRNTCDNTPALVKFLPYHYSILILNFNRTYSGVLYEQLTPANVPEPWKMQCHSNQKFLSIQYPSLPYFPTPYLHHWDFRSTKQALKYKTKHFNLELIHKGIVSFPDLFWDFIYSNPTWTFINSHNSNAISTHQYKIVIIKMHSYKDS